MELVSEVMCGDVRVRAKDVVLSAKIVPCDRGRTRESEGGP